MNNNYDKIAFSYDRLSRLVFSKAQVNAQINQLSFIEEHNSLLIVGGGSGWILEEIDKRYLKGLKIVYVEISSKMIALSKSRNLSDLNVSFINLPIEDFTSDTKFDIILTPFLFDNFLKPKAEMIFFKLDNLLKNDGKWFFVDFTLESGDKKWWKSKLLGAMYLFFRLINIVEAKKLVEMKGYFLRNQYHILNQRFYFKSFIVATVYQKKDDFF